MMAFILIASPQSASAHETHIYKIGNQFYKFVVGSLNEPITVDDNTGVDLGVTISGGPHVEEAGHSHAEVATPVTSLDQTLKVELIAGDKKKVLDLRPAFGAPGKYKAKFYPTVQTTYIYRFFGTLNNIPIDLSFACNPAGDPQVEEDESEVKVSDNVTRTFKRGAFGCPDAKAGLGFPEPAVALTDVATKDQVAQQITQSNDAASSARSYGVAGIVVGILGLLAGVGAWTRKKV